MKQKMFDERYLLIMGLIALFSYTFIVNAWVVDDAYITFRTIDNFVNGYGLTWNTHERVQTFTHPLWLFVLTPAYFLWGNIYVVAIVISYFLSLAAVGLISYGLWRRYQSVVHLITLFLVLLGCKGFVDYTSSGLENPLSYLLAALFISEFLLKEKKIPVSPAVLFTLFFLGGLAFFNRQDTLILYFPSLLYLLLSNLRVYRSGLLLVVLVAILPALGWVIFSFFYYGFPFPNTAYAKALSSGLLFSYKLDAGLSYFLGSIKQDGVNYLLMLMCVGLGIYRKDGRVLLLMGGVILYIVYVVLTAASATHMGGRFFSVPLFISVCVLMMYLSSQIHVYLVALVAVGFIVVNPVSPLKAQTEWYHPPSQISAPSHIDTKFFVQRDGKGGLNQLDGKSLTRNVWYAAGLEYRDMKEIVHIGGAEGGAAVGYFGFASGPHKRIIDIAGLTDPLLARLPACIDYARPIKSGHYYRYLPKGYAESVLHKRNLIVDASLGEYYEVLLNVTTGSLFEWKRIRQIIGLNVGKYQPMLDQYIALEKKDEGYCRNIWVNGVGPFGDG